MVERIIILEYKLDILAKCGTFSTFLLNDKFLTNLNIFKQKAISSAHAEVLWMNIVICFTFASSIDLILQAV